MGAKMFCIGASPPGLGGLTSGPSASGSRRCSDYSPGVRAKHRRWRAPLSRAIEGARVPTNLLDWRRGAIEGDRGRGMLPE